jgi:hypothetical protein
MVDMTELHYMDAARAPANSNLNVKIANSNLRIEVEKGVEAILHLLLYFFLAAFEHVHGDMSFVAIFQFQRRVSYFGDLFGG